MIAKTSLPPKFNQFPDHVAIVPDGNGRWAEQRGLPRLAGHQAGAENMHRMINYLSEYPFTKALWPDFGKKDLEKALLSYSRRKRHFGGL